MYQYEFQYQKCHLNKINNKYTIYISKKQQKKAREYKQTTAKHQNFIKTLLIFKIMQNNYKYDKLNMLIHLQHQRSHYKRVIQAKKCIDFSRHDQNNSEDAYMNIYSNRNKSQNHDSKSSTNTCNNIKNLRKIHKHINNTNNSNNTKMSKFEQLKQKQRKQNNHKLVNRINEINHQNGILQSMYFESQKKNNRNVYSFSAHRKSQEYKIVVENSKIANRLYQTKPIVGTIGEWKTHYRKYKNYEKIVQKNNIYDPQLHLRKTISSLSKNKANVFFNPRQRTSISQTKCIQYGNNDEFKAIKNLENNLTMPKKSINQRKKLKKQLRQNVQTEQNQNEIIKRYKQKRKHISEHSIISQNQGQHLKLQINQIQKANNEQNLQRDENYYKKDTKLHRSMSDKKKK